MLNPDFAIILNFKLADPELTPSTADALVKRARDIGARCIASNSPAAFEAACAKYPVMNVPAMTGQTYAPDTVVEALVAARKAGQPLVIDLDVADGLQEDDQAALTALNKWMHKFGHVVNEGAPCALECDLQGAFLLENRHVSYQDYLFLHAPVAAQAVVTGLEQAPNRVEWVDGRAEVPFEFAAGQLTLDLAEAKEDFAWQVVRIQGHRPEDDLADTKF